jgi:hypothetical protein
MLKKGKALENMGVALAYRERKRRISEKPDYETPD